MIRLRSISSFFVFSILTLSLLGNLSIHPEGVSFFGASYWFVVVFVSGMFFLISFPLLKVHLKGSARILVFLFMCFFLVSMFFVVVGGYAQESFIRLLMIMVPTFVIFALMTTNDDDGLFNMLALYCKAIVLVSILLVMVSLYISSVGSVRYSSDGKMIQEAMLFGIRVGQYASEGTGAFRASSLTKNANIFAAVLMLSALALFFLKKINSGLFGSFWLFTLASLFVATGLFITFSRGSMVSLFLGVAVFIFLSVPSASNRVFLILVGSVLLGVALIVGLFFRVDGLGEGRLAFDLSGREVIWGIAVDKILSNPLSGIGIGVSDYFLEKSGSYHLSMHNSHLNILLEVGVVGYFIYLGMVVWSLTTLVKSVAYSTDYRSRSLNVFVCSVLVALLALQFVESSVFQFTHLHFVFMFFMIMSVVYRGRVVEK